MYRSIQKLVDNWYLFLKFKIILVFLLIRKLCCDWCLSMYLFNFQLNTIKICFIFYENDNTFMWRLSHILSCNALDVAQSQGFFSRRPSQKFKFLTISYQCQLVYAWLFDCIVSGLISLSNFKHNRTFIFKRRINQCFTYPLMD